MNSTLQVSHATGSYPIHIGGANLSRLNVLVGDQLRTDCKHAIITDSNVSKLLLRQTLAQLHPLDFLVLECPAGESSKSIKLFEQFLSKMLNEGCDRKSCVLALGGGVPGDLAGFVAASFMRGVEFIQIPTTLLAQVDSSVGGKTGINLPCGKNTVGAFWPPVSVVIDPKVLATLEDDQYTSGLAEVVKYGIIMDQNFFEFLESNVDNIRQKDLETLEQMILRCCECKAKVVQEDEREISGRRAILNYGHTFGHAIESEFGYGHWPHGHAVAMGMNSAAHLAQTLGICDASLVSRQNDLLKSLNIPHQFPKDNHQALLDAMKRDKKAINGNITYVLPTRLGHVDLVSSIPPDKVLESMQRACKATE